VNGYIGSLHSADDWEQELYEEELETALDDLYTQAEEFRTSGPEVVQSYWDGFQDGLES
jgi:hypothetical protein